MKKIIFIVIICLIAAVFIGCGKKQTTKNVSEEPLLFVSSTCGHCANVKKFISDNEIQNKVQFKEIEAFQIQENTNLFNEKATICAIPNENRGVPLLFDSGKCYLGEVQVMDYFKTKAGIK
jgi:glutaredoxin